MRMYYGAVANEVGPHIFLGEELPGLLVLGEQGQVLPVFSSFNAFLSFVRALYPEQEEGLAACPLGPTFFEVAEATRPTAEAGEIERLVFDPVADCAGRWSDQALEWPARSFCAFLEAIRPLVIRMAGGRTTQLDKKQPHPEQVRRALRGFMKQLWYYLDEDY